MALEQALSGKRVVLKAIDSGLKLKSRLFEMGLFPGADFEVITKSATGPMIIDIRGMRLALGNGILSKIQVEYI